MLSLDNNIAMEIACSPCLHLTTLHKLVIAQKFVDPNL